MPKEIVGLRRYDFEDQKTKERVEGFSVFLQWAEDEVQGVCCEALSVSDKKLEGYVPELGHLVKVGYNKYGKCDFLFPLRG